MAPESLLDEPVKPVLVGAVNPPEPIDGLPLVPELTPEGELLVDRLLDESVPP